MNIRLTK